MKASARAWLLCFGMIAMSAGGCGEITLSGNVIDPTTGEQVDVEVTITANTQLKIAKLGAIYQAVSQAPTLAGTADSTDLERAPVSDFPFGIAAIDGYQVELGNFHLSPTSETGDHFATPLTGTVNLAQADGLAFEVDLALPVGQYSAAGVAISSDYALKAFCRVNDNQLLYTTAAGVASHTCDDWATCEIPADYGYLPRTGGFEGARMETLLTVDEDAGLQIALLIDTSYIATCWDGVGSAFDQEKRLPPFAWHDSAAGSDAEFPPEQATIEVFEMPLFLFVSDDLEEGLPSAETYLAGPTVHFTEANPVDPLDITEVDVYTFVFRADGSFYDGLGNHMRSASNMSKFFEAGEADGKEIRLYPGSPLWSPDLHPDKTFVRNLEIDFVRHDIGVPFDTEVRSGPDCGQEWLNWAGGDEGMECMDEPYTFHWLQIERQ